MVTETEIRNALRGVNDPEMPINIVDLGIVDSVHIEHGDSPAGAVITVDILPTFVGCAMLPVIEDDVRKKIRSLPGVGDVRVQMRFHPPWSVDRISSAGRKALKEFGVTVPRHGEATECDNSPVECPFCGSNEV